MAMNTSYETTTSRRVSSSTSTPHSDPHSVTAYRNSPTPLADKLYRGLTYPIRLLPDFLIIGTQKGGTTSLYNYLQHHPCIISAARKEVHFFDRRLNLNKGLSWYRGHFPTRIERYYACQLRKETFVTGEATPEYLFLPHIPQQVVKVLPHVKLIVLLRNPIDRAYSQYQHAVVQGHETRSFEEAITDQEAGLAEEQAHILQDTDYEPYTYMQHCYLTRSLYIDQLQRWMSLFSREQFLILKSEEFYADPAVSLKQVLDFLSVPASELHLRNIEYKSYNHNSYTTMDMALRKRLMAFFEPHNARLYNFLGVDFGWDT
ncbi:MAG: sulfotransferase domain-containing protein [Ktedonobacteraceae bacterium]